jgi:ribosomal protein L32
MSPAADLFGQPVEDSPREFASCPVCDDRHISHRLAADCCLWTEFGHAQRAEIARGVHERGLSWEDAINQERNRG